MARFSKKVVILSTLSLIVLVSLVAFAFIRSRPSNQTKTSSENKASASPKSLSDLIKGHPHACERSMGFDNYRTFHSFAVDPQDPNTLYAAVEYRGVYKSSDGGKTWEAKNKGLRGYPQAKNPQLPCQDQHPLLVVDPKDPQRLLLTSAPSPGFLTDPSSENGGLFESLDGGENWHQLFKDQMNAWTYEALALDPTGSQTMYVGTNALAASHGEADPNKLYVKKGIVYKTTDSGENWQELPTGLVPDLRSGRLFINPKNPQELLLTSFALPANKGGGKVQSKQLGILKSQDGGESWEPLKSLPQDQLAIREADVSPQNFNNLFVSATPSNEKEFKYYSLDSGQTFALVDTQANLFRYDPHDKTGLRLLGLSVYAQPRTIFESLDGGKSWHSYSSLPKEVNNEARVSNIVWDHQSKNIVYLNGDEGKVWKSVDGGKTWELILSMEKLGSD